MDSTKSSPKTPGRKKDRDFNDVFGGPPRRSSSQESDETVAASSRDPWPGLSDKPVFGEEAMSRRRRYPKNDFFDDIFRGNESLSSSPRKYETMDRFAPGLQLMSPARPLPPKAEPFEGSFPAQFSLPAKLNKGMDLLTFGSLTRSTSKSKDGSSNGSSYYGCSPMSRFSGQANQDKEELRNDFQSSYCFSALSRELNTGAEKSTNLSKYVETETKCNSEEDSSGSEISKNGSHLHFSIYKWANKGGVPVILPFRGSDRLKEKNKLQRCSSAKGWIACESIAKEPKDKLHNFFCTIDRVSSNARSFRNVESVIDSRNEDGERVRIIEEDKISKSESEIIIRLRSTDKNVYGNTVLHSSEEGEKTNNSLSQKDLCEKREREVSAVGKATHRPQPKPLNLFFDNDYEDEQDISEKSAKKLSEILDGKNMKKQDVKKRATSDNVEASTTSVKRSPRNSWDNGKGGVRGKVKEFIKIFNQDASSKPSISINKRVEKIHLNNMQKKRSYPDIPLSNNMSNGASEKNINISVKDTVSDGSKTIVEDPAESLEDKFLVCDSSISKAIQDLTPKISPQFGIDPEEIMAIDTKIRQWSNGKQGNIRSLLSTLQYVLWPDSGWKPVPLVNIIEEPAVKRSYQKALLCLHPDKLQQKDAASDQKYIAEKVFDILQDAWTHLNSVGSVSFTVWSTATLAKLDAQYKESAQD